MALQSVSKVIICFILFMASGQLLGQIDVDFTVDVKEGCSSVTAKFLDKSTSTGSNIVAWEWDLGGVKSDLSDPGRIFASVGSYVICLTVTDDNGAKATRCKQDFVKVYDIPTAGFSADVTSGCAPLLVNYEDLSTSPNGSIIEWKWGLNGSNGIIASSEGSIPIFSEYNEADLYTISLSVTDERGCSHSITQENFLHIYGVPAIEISTSEPIGCTFPMTVDFTNLGEKEGVIYAWDFGNGETFDGFDPSPISYPNEAVYGIQVESMDTRTGCRNSVLLNDYINSGGSILFDFFPKRICQKASVQFVDNSPIEAEEWEWNFGDGSTSTDRDPSHVYSKPGTYEVSLMRRTEVCAGTQVLIYNVLVDENPTLDFSVDVDNTCKLPATARFHVDGPSDGLYRWYIGKPGAYEAILTAQNSTYEFDKFGTFEVRLLKDSDIGCRSIELVDTIEIKPLKAAIRGTTEGCIPFTADMDISSNSTVPLSKIEWNISGAQAIMSTEPSLSINIDEVSNFLLEVAIENELGCVDTIRRDDILRGGQRPSADFGLSNDEICPRDIMKFNDLSDGEVDTWNWTFNDSIFSYEQNPELPFTTPGAYSVSLEVGHNGCYSLIRRDSMFIVNDPTVGFEAKYNCENPFLVNVVNRASKYDSIVWSYFDGVDSVKMDFEDSMVISFPNNTSYVLSLEVYNFQNGCSNFSADTIWISDPQAKFSMTPEEGCAPLDLVFKDLSTDAEKWQYFTEVSRFNDDTLKNPKMRIRTAGEFNEVGLVVTDRHGCQDTTFAPTIRVNTINASFLTPEPICHTDTMNIENTSSSHFGNINQVRWALNDSLKRSEEYNGSFTSADIGKFDVSLYVENEWGCKDSTSTALAAYFRAPNFALAADSLSCTTHEMEFRNIYHASSYSYEWSFGDGDSSRAISPTHLYPNEGSYQLTVRIEDDESCVNDLILDQLVKIADPVANFSADNTSAACPPLVTNYTNLSKNGISYLWNFGDESGTSSEETPSHLYTIPGIFDVGLITVRSEFCQDTILASELIRLDGPLGEFNFEVDSSCVPLSVSFEANLAEEYTITWDFGDGNLRPIDRKTDFSQVDYAYTEAGDFIPKIILEDGENCRVTREGENIQTHVLEAKFESLDSLFCDNIPESILLTSKSFSTSPILFYDWLVGDSKLRGESPEYLVVDTGVYAVQLVATNAFCSDTILKENYLAIGESPMVNLPSDTFNCITTSLNLKATSADEGDLFTWFDSDGYLLAEGSEFSQEEFDDSQLYIFKALNHFGCTSIDTIFVEVIDDQTAFAGPDRTICLGASTEIEITYGEGIDFESILDCGTCRKVEVSPETNTLYPLETTNEYGCVVKDTIAIDVLTPDDIDAGENQVVCVKEKPILLGFAPGDIRWSPSELVDDHTSSLTSANIRASTMFFLEATEGECTLRDSVLIEVTEKAQVEATGDTICFGETAHIFASGEIDDVRWESDGAILSNRNVTNPTTAPEATSNFMAIGSLGGCIPDTAYTAVMVHSRIIGTLPETIRYFEGREEVATEVKLSSWGDYEFMWMPSEIVNCAACPEVLVQITDSISVVAVEIMDKGSGCTDTLEVRLRQFSDCESASETIAIPNIFSPNDDGINDYLEIESYAFDEIRSISIFDRWGQLVFYTEEVLGASWDGRFNGQLVQPGVFAYIIEARCPDTGLFSKRSGDVTVIR